MKLQFSLPRFSLASLFPCFFLLSAAVPGFAAGILLFAASDGGKQHFDAGEYHRNPEKYFDDMRRQEAVNFGAQRSHDNGEGGHAKHCGEANMPEGQLRSVI